MKDTVKIQFEVGGKPMFLESGLLAQQAAGAATLGSVSFVVSHLQSSLLTWRFARMSYWAMPPESRGPAG